MRKQNLGYTMQPNFHKSKSLFETKLWERTSIWYRTQTSRKKHVKIFSKKNIFFRFYYEEFYSCDNPEVRLKGVEVPWIPKGYVDGTCTSYQDSQGNERFRSFYCAEDKVIHFNWIDSQCKRIKDIESFDYPGFCYNDSIKEYTEITWKGCKCKNEWNYNGK